MHLQPMPFGLRCRLCSAPRLRFVLASARRRLAGTSCRLSPPEVCNAAIAGALRTCTPFTGSTQHYAVWRPTAYQVLRCVNTAQVRCVRTWRPRGQRSTLLRYERLRGVLPRASSREVGEHLARVAFAVPTAFKGSRLGSMLSRCSSACTRRRCACRRRRCNGGTAGRMASRSRAAAERIAWRATQVGSRVSARICVFAAGCTRSGNSTTATAPALHFDATQTACCAQSDFAWRLSHAAHNAMRAGRSTLQAAGGRTRLCALRRARPACTRCVAGFGVALSDSPPLGRVRARRTRARCSDVLLRLVAWGGHWPAGGRLLCIRAICTAALTQ